MTKQMFIHELKVALAQVDINTRDEIIADISEHFTEGAAQGLSEGDICRGLGQPGSIAEQVLAEMGSQVSQQTSTQTPPPSQAQHNDPHHEYRYRKGQDLDESFADVNHVTVNLEISNLHLLPSPTGEFRVVIHGVSEKESCSANLNNGNLTVTVKRAWRLFNFSFGKSKVETTIYVPAQFAGEIKVDSSVGNITANNTSGELKLDTSAGNVTINGHSCNRIHADTAAGNVSVRLANSYVDYVHIDTSAGNVDFEAQETGYLNVDTSAGGINARVTKISGETKLDTSAGSVKLTAQQVAGNITLDTSAGSIKVYLPADANCRIDARKPSVGSLHNEITGNPQSPYTLRADSSVGSIHLKAL